MNHSDILPVMELPITGPAKAVLNVIAVRAYPEDHTARLTIDDLVRLSGVSKRAVQRGLKELEASAVLKGDRGCGRRTYSMWFINMERVSQWHRSLQGDTEKKGATQAQKGATQAQKGVTAAPYKEEKIKKGAHAHAHARKMPPRTGSSDPVAKRRKKGIAVNRSKVAGYGMPKFHETTSTEAREAWSNCLQGKTADFRVPVSASLGPIEGGSAYIFNLSGFEASQITQNGRVEIELALKRLTGDRINLILLEKEIAA